MENILVISETKSFIVTSIIQQLMGKDYNVIQVTNKLIDMQKVKDSINLVLIYGEEEMFSDMDGFVYLKDKAIEENIPVFILGDAEQMEVISRVISGQFVKKKLYRPINVKDVVKEVDDYLRRSTDYLKKKILVVDDSGAMLRNVKGWLEDKYQVILANSGALAIKYLAMNHPDLMLLDYEMPICDGKQVLEMIRAEEDFADIPVMFLTGKNDRESVLNVAGLKPEGYLLKSMEPAKIVQAIDDFFEKKKADNL